jgi:hypothetical protein
MFFKKAKKIKQSIIDEKAHGRLSVGNAKSLDKVCVCISVLLYLET